MNTPNFSDIYTLYFEDVYKYLLALCHDEELAEELAQDTFFKAKLFEIIMLKSNRVFDYYSALQELFKDKIKQADKDKMIYNIDIERKGYCYPQRSLPRKTQKIVTQNAKNPL